MSFVLNIGVETTAGAPQANLTTDVCSMSVIPQGSTIPNDYFGPYNTLDFESKASYAVTVHAADNSVSGSTPVSTKLRPAAAPVATGRG